ncbi:MAG: TonB family protein [Bacteroidaceae bacterium]|nr:TonB family protein [Bacteroidaceae bacterium]
MNLKAGATLERGKYRIISVLGQGGFGITYLGEQIYLGRKVAIKEFFIDIYCERDPETSHVSVPTANNKALVERFRRKFIKEAQNIASLNHRNIVPVIDVFEENGTAYYVMEHLDGGSLSAKLKDGCLPEDVAVRYVKDIASALAEVHAHNILHLDIKPANIMLNSKDEAVLIDFGISKRYDEGSSHTNSSVAGFTEGYAPIEQYETGELKNFSAATDIYSLGATFYKMVTGNMPPKATEVYNDGLPPLPENLSPGTRMVIENSMQPRRKDRPQTIAEFLDILDGKNLAKKEEPRTVVITKNEINNTVKPVENPENSPARSKLPFVVASTVISILLVIGAVMFIPAKCGNGLPEDAVEQYYLGHRYNDGDGVEQSHEEAAKLWRLSADQHYAPAQYELGLCYYRGKGVQSSYEEAAKWIKLSSEQNYAAAQCWLGYFYEVGKGVEKSHDEAVKWYRKSAEQGNATAQYYLAMCYDQGKGVEQSQEEAVKWYRKAAEQGNEKARKAVEKADHAIAAKRIAEETEARRKAENAAKKMAEENAAKKMAEENAAKKMAEENAAKKMAEEEAERERLEAEKRMRAEEEERMRAAENEIHQVVEVQPEFPGGMKALMKYLQENIQYPRISRENNSQGRVFVRFIVNTDGSIQGAEVMKSSGDIYLDKEAVRVVSGMPKWSPARQSGKAVRVYFVLPVVFRLT